MGGFILINLLFSQRYQWIFIDCFFPYSEEFLKVICREMILSIDSRSSARARKNHIFC